MLGSGEFTGSSTTDPTQQYWTGGLVGVVAAVVAVISTCVCSYVTGKHRRGREGRKRENGGGVVMEKEGRERGREREGGQWTEGKESGQTMVGNG